MSIIKQLAGVRRLPGPGSADPLAKAQGKAADPAAFTGAQISEKVVKKYGLLLQPHSAELATIGRLAATIKPHKVTQFGNALDRYYGALGKAVEDLEPKARDQVVKLSVRLLGSCVERLGPSDRLVGGIEVLTSLLFQPKPKDLATFGERGKSIAAVWGELLDLLEGRAGANGSLFVFRNIVESAALGRGLTLPEEVAVWRGALGLLAKGTPLAGASQAQLGALFGHFQAALKQAPTLDLAFTLAAERALEPNRAGVAALVEQLGRDPGLDPATPAAQAYRALADGLKLAIDAAPASLDVLGPAVEQLTGRVMGMAYAITAEGAPVYAQLGRLLGSMGERASLPAIVQFLAQALPELAEQPGMAARLKKVKSLIELPRALIEAQLQRLGREGEDLGGALRALNRLPSGLSVAAAVTLLPHLAAGQVPAVGLIEAATALARGCDTVDELRERIDGFASAYPYFLHLGEPVALELAQAHATTIGPAGFDAGKAAHQANVALQVRAHLPDLPIDRLAAPDTKAELSLLSVEPYNPQGRAPLDYVTRLLPALANLPAEPPDLKIALARRIFALAHQVAQLDKDPETIMPQLIADWTRAVNEPRALQFALPSGKGGAVQAKGDPNALGVLMAHPELPIELALTASLALNTEQLTWLTETIRSERSHARIRQLRDLVMNLVQAGQLPLLDAIRTAAVDGKLKTALIAWINQEFRAGNGAQLPFGELIGELQAGRDPLGPKAKAQAAAALAAIFPDGGGLGALDPTCAAEIQRNQNGLLTFLGFFQPGTQIWNLPAETFQDPLIAWVRAYAEGRIIEHKYHNALADQQLAKLSPQARALWEQESVTQAARAAAPEQGPEVEEARQLLRGLRQAMAKVKIQVPRQPEMAADAASLATLEELRGQHLEALRAGKKGSKAHRAAQQAMRPVTQQIALLRLKLALDELPAEGAFEVGSKLNALKPLLLDAAGPMRRVGGIEVAEVMLDLASRAKAAPVQAREGIFAADENRLEAFLTSFSNGSCIDPLSGFNRPCIVEKMANPRYKICRAVDGERGLARAWLRLMSVRVGNYDGLALWLDYPQAVAGADAETQKLMYRHAMNKALAMGIPFFCNGAYGGQINEVAGERQLPVENLDVTVVLDRGITGNHHTEYMSPIAPYGVRWPESTWEYGYKVAAAPDANIEMNAAVTIVFPAGLAH